MDVETVQAIAPHATVLYFSAPLIAFGDAVNAVVRDGRAHVATYSAGGCDEMWLANKDARAVRLADAQRGEGRGRRGRERLRVERRQRRVQLLALRPEGLASDGR